MKKIFAVLGIVTFAVVGCDDSSSASAGQNDEPAVESSSSSGKVTEPAEETSSSSEKAKSSSSKNEESSSSEKSSSSSSVILSASEESSSSLAESSSSVAESSSSVVTPQSSSSSTSVSSSSADVQSSSSEAESSSSSSEDKVNCLALLEGETGWSWDVPKECRFNPDIDYGTMTDERDGKVYRTVKIGDQTWMAENLNFDVGQGGSGENVYEWSWCYNNEPKNCEVAGRIYTWAAAIDSVKLATDADDPQECGFGKICGLASASSATLVQGVCPTGWHLPSNTEWNILFTKVGGKSNAGKVLKAQTGWIAYSGVINEDAVGFTALPAVNGGYRQTGISAVFWSSTENNSDRAYYISLYCGDDEVILTHNPKNKDYSVRCVKD